MVGLNRIFCQLGRGNSAECLSRFEMAGRGPLVATENPGFMNTVSLLGRVVSIDDRPYLVRSSESDPIQASHVQPHLRLLVSQLNGT
jgi:hypothetical protein